MGQGVQHKQGNKDLWRWREDEQPCFFLCFYMVVFSSKSTHALVKLIWKPVNNICKCFPQKCLSLVYSYYQNMRRYLVGALLAAIYNCLHLPLSELCLLSMLWVKWPHSHATIFSSFCRRALMLADKCVQNCMLLLYPGAHLRHTAVKEERIR